MSKYSFQAVIFDLDGVITKTAHIHAQAWKVVFDEYLRLRQKRDAEEFREFTPEVDYLFYVDGKPRYKGVQSFLESRGIKIPYGDPSDPPEKETICGVGNKKNELFLKILKKQGAEVFSSSVEFINKLKKSSVRIGVASSSKSCKIILESVNLDKLFETRIDGIVSAELGLKGKPEPDIFTLAASRLNSDPGQSVIVEDASSGVQAGRNGGFGLVLGLARQNNEKELLENGADVVVRDLAQISPEWIEQWFQKKPRPLFEFWETETKFEPDPAAEGNNITVNPIFLRKAKEIFSTNKKIVFFLDYDGTLVPMAQRPELAVISPEIQNCLKELSQRATVAIVSGRMREDVEKLVGIKGLFFAGSYGLDIQGPGLTMLHPKAKETIPVITELVEKFSPELTGIKGILIEEKKFSVAIHYRLVEEKDLPRIENYLRKLAKDYSDSLCLIKSKKVFEFLPNTPWDKGQAIRWIMKALNLSWKESSVIYIGDDLIDEYAFRIIRTRGASILVSEQPRPSAADFWLPNPNEVKKLLKKVISLPPTAFR